MLEYLGEKIESMKHSMGVKKEVYWKEDSSENSIVVVSRPESARSKHSQSKYVSPEQQDTNKLFMAELEKLRSKLDEQEDRFKKLAQENSELKSNLSRIHSEPHVELSRDKDKRSVGSELELNQQVITLRIESEESVDESSDKKRGKDSPKRPTLDMPLIIDTDESQRDI